MRVTDLEEKRTAARQPKQGNPIIDCDVHHTFKHISMLYPYLPRKHTERIELWGGGFGGGPGTPNGGKGGRMADSHPPSGGPPCSDLPFMAEQHLDRYNVHYAILTGEFIESTFVADPYYAAAVCSAFNDFTIEHWLDKDSRLRGSIYLPIHDIAASVQEIERVGSHPGMVQAYVPGGTHNPYGKRIYHPIYEACVKHGLNLAIHVGGEGSGMNPATTNVGYPSYYVEYRMARTQAFMAHMASLIFEGVFELYPELQVVFIEGGVFWVAPFLWKLDQEWRALREQSPWVTRKPSEYFQSNILIGSQPIEQTPNRAAFDIMMQEIYAKDRLVFCSDYPHWDFDSPKQAFPKMDKQLLHNIMYNNAAKLYKLPLLDALEE